MMDTRYTMLNIRVLIKTFGIIFHSVEVPLGVRAFPVGGPLGRGRISAVPVT